MAVLVRGFGRLGRPERPKPFLKVLGDRTLLEQTLDRVADRSRFAEPIVVVGEAPASLVADQVGLHSLIVEPAARNTAPAIALAAARLPSESVMLVCPSDHQIADKARLAVGFQAPADADAIRRGALDGSIMEMLDWIDVNVNDFIYLPAGTVHSMGAGLTLIEIQQNTDITHRLYDYGRGRPLNLDEAMASIRRFPHPPEFRRWIDPTSEQILVEGPHFLLAQSAGKPSRDLQARFQGTVQLLPIDGCCLIDGAQIEPGAAGWTDCLERIDFSHSRHCLLIANSLPLFQSPSASEY